MCVRERLGKGGQECVCVVCLSLSLLIKSAVWPKPEILVSPLWITARDLSAAGGTERDLRKLGLIRSTSPDLLSQSGIRPRCVHAHCSTSMHVFNTPTEPQSHWPIYSTVDAAKTQEAGQTHRGQNNTKAPYGDINSFTWNTFYSHFYTPYKWSIWAKNLLYWFLYIRIHFCCVKSQLQQRSLCRIWSP